jgi:hypothetical protein
MNVVWKAGIALGVAVLVLTMISGFTGMYKNPSGGWIFPVLATVIELGVLFWALRQTAALKRYGGQVGTGVLAAVVGGVIIIFSSLLFTAMFPDYKEASLATVADGWRDAGMSEDQIQKQLPGVEFMMRPVPQAIFGFVMTVLTGLVGSLIIAAFVRKKD